MYQFMLVWLAVAAIIQFARPEMRINKILFWISVAILTCMQAFRYGQGNDYWGYRAIYASAPYKRGFPLYWYTCDLHGEKGFKLLINIFTNLGMSATIFYGIFGTVIMCFIIWAIKKYSPYNCLSLLLLYPTVYLTYVLSGIRQAMVTAIFLAFALELLRKEKYLKYIAIVLLCSSIHVMALFFLILLPIKWIKEKWILYCVPLAWIVGILIAFTPIHEWLGKLLKIEKLLMVEISIGGLLERTLMFGVISILYWRMKEKKQELSFLYKVYGIGYLVAIAGMTTAYGSQRITMPFKAVEIILIPMLLSKECVVLWKKTIGIVVCLFSIIMCLKNLNYYRVEYSALTYPYHSVFGKEYPDIPSEKALESIHEEWENIYNG